MTKNSDFKKLVRERMAKTGESYAAARRQLEQPGATLDGWIVTGPGDGNDPDWELTDFEGGLDNEITFEGKPCAFLRSTVPDPAKHGVIMQSISAAQYRGKRIRFSGAVRCDRSESNGGLWVRVVPHDRNLTLSRGHFVATGRWQHGDVVVDVAPTATSIMFGVSLHGPGTVWMCGADFETVDENVPITPPYVREPTAPMNLDFRGE